MKAFVDANVLLRFITKRPPEQAERAKTLLQRAERGLLTLLLTPLIVAEVLYVLEGVYDYPRERAGSELKALCLTRALTLTEAEATLAALDSRINRNIDFVDAYLVARAGAMDCFVATFDKDIKKLGGRQLSPGDHL